MKANWRRSYVKQRRSEAYYQRRSLLSKEIRNQLKKMEGEPKGIIINSKEGSSLNHENKAEEEEPTKEIQSNQMRLEACRRICWGDHNHVEGDWKPTEGDGRTTTY
jgi:hypothetical protein